MIGNEPDFPQTNEQRYDDPVQGVIKPSDIYGAASSGITIRQYFVAQAMNAWIISLTRRKDEHGYSDTGACYEAARLAVETADDCLKLEVETRK